MRKEDFYRKDYKTFKPKYFLFCQDCKAKFPQKIIKQQENRTKRIIITENLAQ